MSAHTMRFVSDALFYLAAEGVCVEGDVLRGLHEIIEDHLVDLQRRQEALERDHAKAEVELQRLMAVLFGSGAH